MASRETRVSAATVMGGISPGRDWRGLGLAGDFGQMPHEGILQNHFCLGRWNKSLRSLRMTFEGIRFVVSHPCRDETASWTGHQGFMNCGRKATAGSSLVAWRLAQKYLGSALASSFQYFDQISRMIGIIMGRRPVVFWISRFSSTRTFSFTMP
jgi:hypothetical protein